jgi:membrane protein implicated in regulation of membrane protease activity
MPSWAWATLAAGLGLLELHAPRSYLIWIAFGAALTAAIRAAFDLPITMQIVTFAAASTLSCLVGFFVYRRFGEWRSKAPLLNKRSQQLVGARGVVCSPIVKGEGKVRLGDTVWLAEGPALEDGTLIVVSSVRGARVMVQPANPRLP